MTRAFLTTVLGVLLVTRSAAADYLEIRRTAWLKASPESDGEQVQKLGEGDLVALTNDEQENGYYRVHTQNGQPGYVYRTLVRRHVGDLPEDSHPPVGDGIPVHDPDPSPASSIGLDTFPPFVADGSEMRVHLIDVGQGAATLLEFSCGAVLVDTGGESNGLFNSGDAIHAYLDAFFDARPDMNRTLDLVVLTHPHKDHTQNAQVIKNNYTVRNVATDGASTGSGIAMQNWLRSQMSADHLETVTADGIPAGGRTNAVIDPVQCAGRDPKLKVLWGSLAAQPAGWTKTAFDNENNHSVTLRVDFGSASMLITGDLQEEGIEALLEKHQGTNALDVDVWQVGHHGSHNGTTPELLAALTPTIALLGTGPEDRHIAFSAWDYGHPRKNAFDLLVAAIARSRPTKTVPIGIAKHQFTDKPLSKAIYATGWDGSVVIKVSDGEYQVRTER